MSEDVLNLPEFLDRVQDDKELLLELFDIYQEDYKEKRELLGKAIEEKNTEEVHHIAHSLKGSSGNISANQIRESFLKLETMGKEGDLSAAADTLAAADQEYESLAQRIDEVRSEMQS